MQPVVKPVKQLAASCKQTSKKRIFADHFNGPDRAIRLACVCHVHLCVCVCPLTTGCIVYTAGCQTGLTTGLATGCIHDTTGCQRNGI